MTASKAARVRRAIRKARWAIRFIPRERRAWRTYLRKMAAKGRRPWYATGDVITHLSISPIDSLTVCCRVSHQNSSDLPRTLIGYTCRTCQRAWVRAVREAEAVESAQ